MYIDKRSHPKLSFLLLPPLYVPAGLSACGDKVNALNKFENLEEDFKQVQDKFDCHAPLLRTGNISQGKLHYGHYYTSPRLVDLVSEYYKEDIAELGYTYEV